MSGGWGKEESRSLLGFGKNVAKKCLIRKSKRDEDESER